LKALILSQNYENYTGGYYHQDWVDALKRRLECDIYGPAYDNYEKSDDIFSVAERFNKNIEEYDLIIIGSSWDKPGQKSGDGDIDIHPAINLAHVHSPVKIYFLNKEYINLEAKLEYAMHNNVDYIVSVLGPTRTREWESKTGIAFIHLPFAVALNRVVLDNATKKYDFAFTGALHMSYSDSRRLVKAEIFKKDSSFLMSIIRFAAKRVFPTKNWEFLNNRSCLPSNVGISRVLSMSCPVKREWQGLDVYWAERGLISKSLMLKSLLPFGDDYFKFLASSKTFLSTLSAENILGPRFYELMASHCIIICPRDDYGGLLRDKVNCLMYDKPSDVLNLVKSVVTDEDLFKYISDNAYNAVLTHTYDARIDYLMAKIVK